MTDPTEQRAMCTRHPDRVAIAEDDAGTLAMCSKCYAEWLQPAIPPERRTRATRVSTPLEVRKASAPEHVNNAKLPAGSPMYYYCHSCGHQTAVLPEDWHETPPPKFCDWCLAHGEAKT